MSGSIPRHFAELDSLRGLGILAVLWTHAGLNGIGGAFLFVDMFFVISGFLITTSFMKNYREVVPTKSTWAHVGHFFSRRIRRIVPTLFIALLLTLIAGWFVLLPQDYMQLAQSTLFTAFISGNVYAGTLGNYFSTPPSQAPLLHTWSLALEEQFYIITPLLLLPLIWFPQRIWILALSSASVLSILLATQMTFDSLTQNDAYFLFRTRIWQFLLGVIAALLVLEGVFSTTVRYRQIFGYSALAVFLVPTIVFTKSTPTPSILSAVPLFGFAVFAFFKPENRYCDVVLKSRVLTYLGRSTYSVYLIHFPVMAFMTYRGISLGSFHGYWMVLLSLFLGLVFAHLIEDFRKQWRDVPFAWVTAVCGGTLTAIVFGAMLIFASQGAVNRLPELAQSYSIGALDLNPERGRCMGNALSITSGYSCSFDIGSDRTVVLIGDSHSDAIAPAFIDDMHTKGFNVIHLWFAGCPPFGGRVFEVGIFSDECEAFNKSSFLFIESLDEISGVFFVARWTWYFEGQPFSTDPTQLRFKRASWLPIGKSYPEGFSSMDGYQARVSAVQSEMLRSLSAKTTNLYMFEPIPEMYVNVPKFAAKAIWYTGQVPLVNSAYSDYLAYNQFFLSHLRSLERDGIVKAIPTAGAFCDVSSLGMCNGLRGSSTLYYDSHHLNNLGAKILLNWVSVK